MATSRRSSSRQRSSRRAASPSSSQQAIYVGIGAVVVLALVIVFVSSGNGKPANNGSGDKSTPAKAAGSNQPAPKPPVAKPEGASPGKTPDTPAPALTADTLARLDELHGKASDKYNEAVRARTSGDPMGARKAAGEAREFLLQWKAAVQVNLDWQEYAQMEDWSQPAAYLTLERKFQAFATLNKKVRMGGG